MFSTFSSIIFSETPNGPKIYDFLILTHIFVYIRKDIRHSVRAA